MATKTPAPALKKIKRIVRKEKPTQSGDILTIRVAGSVVGDYIKTSTDKKDAEALMKEIGEEIREEALVELLPRNVDDPTHPLTTITLVDDGGATVRVSYTSKYGATDEAEVTAAFAKLGKNKDKFDINNYVVETLKAAFDSKVFLKANGDFNQSVYDKFRTAIARVAEEVGVENPLTTTKVLIPKPDFHERRWRDFTAAEQVTITSVLPNTISITPVLDAKPK